MKFRESLLEADAKRRRVRSSSSGAPKPSKPETIKNIISNLNSLNKKSDVTMEIYDELDRGYLSELSWENFIQPGDYSDYYNDSEKEGLIKKVLVNYKKALDKMNISYNAADAKKAYIKNAYDKGEANDDIIYLALKLKKIGYNKFENYRDAERFIKKFNVTSKFLSVLGKESAETVMNLASSGIESISFEEIEHKEHISVGSRTSTWTEEYKVNIVEYDKSHTWSFIVSHSDTNRI